MSTINITKKNSSLFKTDVSAVVSLFFLVSGLSHTIPFCSMFCLTDFEEWETVHSLPLFKQTDQSHSGRSDEKKHKGQSNNFAQRMSRVLGVSFTPSFLSCLSFELGLSRPWKLVNIWTPRKIHWVLKYHLPEANQPCALLCLDDASLELFPKANKKNTGL